MGRHFPITRLQFTCALLAGWLCLASARAAEEGPRALVLVGSATGTLPTLSIAEVRRLYLGRAVEKNGTRLEPIRNVSDPLLYEVFLQKVLFMSAQNYERHILTQVYQSGGPRPSYFDDRQALVAALKNQPAGVTFMWRADALASPEVRIIQVLWLEKTP